MHIWILFGLAAFELALVVYILVRYVRSGSILALCAMLVGFAGIAFFVGLQLVTNDNATRSMLARAAFYSGAVAFTSLLALAIEYPIPDVRLHRFLPHLIIFALAFSLPYIFLYPGFLNGVTRSGSMLEIIPGKGFWVIVLFTALYFLATMITLIRKIPLFAGEQKRLLMRFTVWAALAGSIGLGSAILLPALRVPVNATIGGEIHGVLSLFIASVVLRKV